VVENSGGVHLWVDTTRPKLGVSGHRGHQWIVAYVNRDSYLCSSSALPLLVCKLFLEYVKSNHVSHLAECTLALGLN